MFDQFGFIGQFYPQILQGFTLTLEITAFGVTFGLLLGTLLAVGDIYGNKVARSIIGVYVELFRGSPLFVQLFLAVYGIPAIIHIPINHYLLAFLIFGLNSAAYQKGYMKGAIEAVYGDQMDAGLSTGMSKTQTLLHVILPQAYRIVIPSWTNEFCSLTKSSSALAWVGIFDLTAAGVEITGIYYVVLPVWIVIGVIYLIWISAMAKVFDYLYEKWKIPGIELNMQ